MDKQCPLPPPGTSRSNSARATYSLHKLQGAAQPGLGRKPGSLELRESLCLTREPLPAQSSGKHHQQGHAPAGKGY